MIVVTHELGFALKAAHRAVFMADGVVVEQGTPEEVINHPRHERTRAFFRKLT
jgi:polar amino acid transport system ATP-binding protein